MANDKDEFRIRTPEFRGSFVHLLTPRKRDKDKPAEYTITIVLPKENPFWKRLDLLIEKAARKKFGDYDPDELVTTRKDADKIRDKKDRTKLRYPEWKGCYTIEAKCKEDRPPRPGIVMRDEDGDIVDVTERSDIYSGAYYVATVRVGPWTHVESNRFGVSLFLENVCKMRDGKPFSSRATAAEDFADFVGGSDGGALD